MVTRAPTSDDGAPGVSPGGSGAAASGASGGLGPDDDLPAGSAGRRRAGRLPSLAELGAFDLPEPAPPRPRLSGRLTEEDLRGLAAGTRLSSVVAGRHFDCLSPIDDVRATAAYRLEAARLMIGEALDLAAGVA